MAYRKIPQATKDELCRLYLEELMSVKDAAAATGISVAQAYKILENSSEITKHQQKMRLRDIRADMMMHANVEKAARKMISMIDEPVADKYKYIQQNAARDVLDRVGIRAKDEEDGGVTITFAGAGMPEMNMPPASDSTVMMDGDNQS